MPKLLSFSNTDWYLHNYRVPIDSRLRQRGWEVVMASPGGRFSPRIEAEGFRWREVPMSRSGINPLEEWRTMNALAKVIREEKPDVLHTFTMKGNINGSLAARLAGLRNIVNSIAGLGYVYSSNALKARLLRAPANAAYRLAMARGRVVFQNTEDFDIFVRAGLVPRERAALIRSSGVDTGQFRPAPPPEGPVRILFAARLLWTKGIGELVEAARRLKAAAASFELLVAGEPDAGNPETISQVDLEVWQREGLVTALGFHEDMASLMAGCHIVCFPSKHKEGTPKFLVEAAACGLPIVTTRNRGCTEVVRDGDNGLLVPVGDVPALVTALGALIKDPALRARMGARGREIAVREFSVDEVARQTLEVYESLLR